MTAWSKLLVITNQPWCGCSSSRRRLVGMESTEQHRELLKTTVHELPIPHFELLKVMMLVRTGRYLVSYFIAILTLDQALPPNLCNALRHRYPSYGSGPLMDSNSDAPKRSKCYPRNGAGAAHSRDSNVDHLRRGNIRV